MDRLVGLAKYEFLLEPEYQPGEGKSLTGIEKRKCAFLASKFEGAALDWATSELTSNPSCYNSFDGFITAVRNAFGIDTDNTAALLRRELDALSWQTDTPIFFADFDRLTRLCSITTDEGRITLLLSKLPQHVKVLFAQQGLSFANYSTMRGRLNMMWALDPTVTKQVTRGKPKCEACGKKGHTSSQCKTKN